MGNLLKEALKTLCGVNQWSYAVFWKIGYQNPNLLIWEECYYNSNSYSTHQDFNASCGVPRASNFQSQYHTGEKVPFLINSMMMDNQVNIVGEGLVGRVAFTRNHQWILSENFCGESHPPEVLNEVRPQFSAGMKTVAVIPVLPHGVVQFGSYLTIEENLGFVHDVVTLVFQLGEVTGVLLSDNFITKEPARRFGVPVCFASSTPVDSSPEFSTICASSFIADSLNHVECSVQTSALDTQTSDSFTTEIRNDLKSTVAAIQALNSCPSCMRACYYNHTARIAPTVKAEVTPPSNSEIWRNQQTSVYVPRSTLDLPSSTCLLNPCGRSCNEQLDYGCQGPFSSFSGIPFPFPTPSKSFALTCSNEDVPMMRNVKMLSRIDSCSRPSSMVYESFTSKSSASIGINNVNLLKREASLFDSVDHLRTNSLLGNSSYIQYRNMEKKVVENDFYYSPEELNISQTHDRSPFQLNEHRNTVAQLISSLVEDDKKHKLDDLSHAVNDTKYDESYVQSQSGDDLFDILGADFKNMIFSSRWKSCKLPPSTDDSNINIPSTKILASSEIYAASEGNLDSGGSDQLMNAVVSNVNSAVKPILDGSVSCGTTLTNASSSSQPNTRFSYSQCGVFNQMKGELLGVPKCTSKPGAMSSCSLTHATSKKDSGTSSWISSLYGSQVSSGIEKGHNMNPNNSVSTGCSKKPDETTKPNRKRLKPGDNPRPRPKDRQMIQDRFKELRQIVPNGAKCSMDALLERTIKHMLFLQSVTKHADKLKQSGEPKIIDRDGSLLLKNNFEGGATWAYEVGSQSMVCPLIVEDLDQPRQMVVEMLCEERGFFLEIADIIRGLGLTILKGVMETRNGKIWARFSVEANRDVTRMEIFLSLVHLLEQSSKKMHSTSKQHKLQQNNRSINPSYADSLPVTGVSHNFH